MMGLTIGEQLNFASRPSEQADTVHVTQRQPMAICKTNRKATLSTSDWLGILAEPHPTRCHGPMTETDTVAFQVFPELLGDHIHARSSWSAW